MVEIEFMASEKLIKLIILDGMGEGKIVNVTDHARLRELVDNKLGKEGPQMKKLIMIVLSVLLGVSVVFLGGRSYAQYTQHNSYWETAFQGMAPLSQGVAEGSSSVHQETDWDRATGELNAFGQRSSGPVLPIGAMNPFVPYSGK